MASNFTNISDIISQQTQQQYAQHITFFKDTRMGTIAGSSPVAGGFNSLWQYNGCPSGVLTAPAAAAICDRTTSGSVGQTNPISGKLYCMGAVAVSTLPGTLIVYDRLCQMGGLSGVLTTNQVVSASASTRYTGSASAGNQLYVEVYTTIGTTQVSINATYINQNGLTAVTATGSIGGTALNRSPGNAIQLQLASGDTGVQAVNSIHLSATTGTAGNICVFIGHPITTLPLSTPSVASVRDTVFGVPALPEILPNACLAFLWVANTSALPQIHGELQLLEK